MKDRSIKELLQLMLDSEHLFTSGLCPLQVRLRDMRMIAPSEDILLRKFLMDNLPPNTFLHPFGITGFLIMLFLLVNGPQGNNG